MISFFFVPVNDELVKYILYFLSLNHDSRFLSKKEAAGRESGYFRESIASQIRKVIDRRTGMLPPTASSRVCIPRRRFIWMEGWVVMDDDVMWCGVG